MAITIETAPTNYGRVYDTNRLMYKFSSTNSNNPNFRFYISVGVGDITQNPVTYSSIAIVRKRPLANGTCFFNPAELWSNYLTQDIDVNVSSLQECLNSNSMFQIAVGEEYGDTPELINPSIVIAEPIMLYNGLQEYIPYDIEAYGGGNLQWVMSGTTVTQSSWVECGTWTNETGTFGTQEIKFTGADIMNLTSIQISYTDSSNTNRTGCLNSISTDEYVAFYSSADVNEVFFIRYGSKVDTATSTTWSDITYEDKGSTMSTAGFADGAKIIIKYTELNETRGPGRWLTDATEFQVAPYEYNNLYFIAGYQDKPTYARIKVYYWSDGVEPVGPGGGGSELMSYVNNASKIKRNINIAQSAPNPDAIIQGFKPPPPDEDPGDPDTGGDPITPSFKYFISSYNTGMTLNYTNLYNQMYYIPTGPKELEALGIFDRANGDGGWISYKIDLTNSIASPTKIYNKYPMWYYKKLKCDKYDPIQLFWLNPHGGFDTYTFYKKNYIEYDVQQTRWQHRFSDTYTLGERGTTVYKTLANKKVVLNTDYLTASESQTLSQLLMSPEIYATYTYNNGVYKIPYVIDDSKFQYKEVKNEKMVTYEITIIPAFNRVSQTS